MFPALELCLNYLRSCLTKEEHVLVHCNAGVSRSATVVIAFLMKEKNFSFQEAFHHVKKRRPCIRPNEGFVKQLQLLEHIQDQEERSQ